MLLPTEPNAVPKTNDTASLPVDDGIIEPTTPSQDTGEQSQPVVSQLTVSDDGTTLVEIPSEDPNATLTRAAADMSSKTTADANEPDSKLFSRNDIRQYINEFRAYIFKLGQDAIGATMGIISSSVFVVIFVIFLIAMV